MSQLQLFTSLGAVEASARAAGDTLLGGHRATSTTVSDLGDLRTAQTPCRNCDSNPLFTHNGRNVCRECSAAYLSALAHGRATR